MKKEITLCFNIYGCPNSCKHCHVSGAPSKKMDIKLIEKQVEKFKAAGYRTDVYSWYLEPDFPNNYKELFSWEQNMSDKSHEHFELASDFRIVRDKEYVKWLKELGLKKVQLTFFGMEELTNYYTGRNNAFNELIEAIDILIENEIAPRIQYFLYKDTINELDEFISYIDSLKVEERCNSFNSKFELFVHTGSCLGTGINLYEKWITDEDLVKIPAYVIDKTLEHYKVSNFNEVLGSTEQDLYQKHMDNKSFHTYESNNILYVDNKYNVLPNSASLNDYWIIGNLFTDSVEEIMDKYLNGDYYGNNISKTHSIGEMIKEVGNPNSIRLFNEDDYLDFVRDMFIMRKYNK